MSNKEAMPKEAADLLAAADRKEGVSMKDVANVAVRGFVYRRLGLIDPDADNLGVVRDCITITQDEGIISAEVAELISHDEELAERLVELDEIFAQAGGKP